MRLSIAVRAAAALAATLAIAFGLVLPNFKGGDNSSIPSVVGDEIDVQPGEVQALTTVEPFVSHDVTWKQDDPAKPTVLAASASPSNMKKIVTYITFYGWADNDPPGKAIAYPHTRYPQSLHNEAGGVGTYEDPITYAAARNQWPVGTRMYIPTFGKYFILEDLCASCSTNQDQIDIWMESDDSHETELLRCENRWTKRGVEAEVNPAPDRPVDLVPFFNSQTGTCR